MPDKPLRPAKIVGDCDDWSKVDIDVRRSMLWTLTDELASSKPTKSEMSLLLACWHNESAGTYMPLRPRKPPTSTSPSWWTRTDCQPIYVPLVAWDPFVSNKAAFQSSPLAKLVLKSGLADKTGKRLSGDLNIDPVVFEAALGAGDEIMLKQFSVGVNQYHLGTHLGAPYKPPYDWTPSVQSLRDWWYKACLSVRTSMSIAVPYSTAWAKGYVDGEDDSKTIDRLKKQAGSGYAATYWSIIKPIARGFYYRMNLK